MKGRKACMIAKSVVD